MKKNKKNFQLKYFIANRDRAGKEVDYACKFAEENLKFSAFNDDAKTLCNFNEFWKSGFEKRH
jgi:hypothetical protein